MFLVSGCFAFELMYVEDSFERDGAGVLLECDGDGVRALVDFGLFSSFVAEICLDNLEWEFTLAPIKDFCCGTTGEAPLSDPDSVLLLEGE